MIFLELFSEKENKTFLKQLSLQITRVLQLPNLSSFVDIVTSKRDLSSLTKQECWNNQIEIYRILSELSGGLPSKNCDVTARCTARRELARAGSGTLWQS
jgi:hypothetical protein